MRSSGQKAASRPPTTVPLHPDQPWWLQRGFAPVTKEVEGLDLPVHGALPPELSGLYVRNGSNPRTGTSPHWFFGDGMVHGVRIEDGQGALVPQPLRAHAAVRGAAGFGAGAPGGAARPEQRVVHPPRGKLLTLGEVGLPVRAATRRPVDGRAVHDFGGRADDGT